MNLADRLNGKPERHMDTNYEMMIALAADISTVTHIDLLMMMEWFRSLPVFPAISLEDRVMLIKVRKRERQRDGEAEWQREKETETKR